jgi:MFS family permease
LAIVAAICGAEILTLAGFSIVPALLPQFIAAWSLTNTEAGWLAGITSAGYMLAVIPLVSLTDRRPARQIYLASSILSALSCFGMALSDSLLPALGFRALAGIAMAGMYMPGLRALTHGVDGATRARIAAWYTSSFTIGASLSFLFGRVGTLLGWRMAFVIAGILGAAGVLTAWAVLPHGDSGREEELWPRLDFRPVLANRDVLALTIGYAAAIWGCVGLRQWIVVFLTFRAVVRDRLRPCAIGSARSQAGNNSIPRQAFAPSRARRRSAMLKGLTSQLIPTVTAIPRHCSATRCNAPKSTLISIGTIISQISTATGILTSATVMRPSIWNGAGSNRPRTMPPPTSSDTAQRSPAPAPLGAGLYQ